MMLLYKTYFLFFIVGYVVGLEVIPERPQVDYLNEKYIKSLKLRIKKKSRNSPSYIDLDVNTVYEVGNNWTLDLQLFEQLSGRYILTPIRMSYKLCDFLYKEPFLGQMYAKQLSANWSCPFPPGEHHFHDMVVHLENFPFNIPFTWASVTVLTRADVDGYITATKEALFKIKAFITIIQKPKKN